MRGSDSTLRLSRSSMGACGLAVRGCWTCVRLPLLALLVILEPLVRLALSALALLLVLTALFFEAVSARATPFWAMLGAGVGCVALLALYQGVIRALS